MGNPLCKPTRKKVTGSSWVADDYENPFQAFNKKERSCLRETYQRLSEPKEIIGCIFVDIVNDVAPELKKVFGVERAPKVSMLKMPKLGGHVARVTEFIDQLTTMLDLTENIVGAWQLIRKTGRSHTKQSFLEANQNQLEKNYFSIVGTCFMQEFIPFMTGEKEEDESKKKNNKLTVNYGTQMIKDIWERFFTIIINQLTESFELEKQKLINLSNQKTLAPHQQVEEDQRRKRQAAQDKKEEEDNYVERDKPKDEELFEDPF
uniref:GLOBIN domain-containing protein n=1 Tax=Rhabditophanes sp. KR3021 TaxID=114890 RepID=A0AC35U4T3_9BILA